MCQYLYDNKLLDSSKGLLKLLDSSGGLLKLSSQRMKQYHLYKCVHKFLNQRERERERESNVLLVEKITLVAFR